MLRTGEAVARGFIVESHEFVMYRYAFYFAHPARLFEAVYGDCSRLVGYIEVQRSGCGWNAAQVGGFVIDFAGGVDVV